MVFTGKAAPFALWRGTWLDGSHFLPMSGTESSASTPCSSISISCMRAGWGSPTWCAASGSITPSRSYVANGPTSQRWGLFDELRGCYYVAQCTLCDIEYKFRFSPTINFCFLFIFIKKTNRSPTPSLPSRHTRLFMLLYHYYVSN